MKKRICNSAIALSIQPKQRKLLISIVYVFVSENKFTMGYTYTPHHLPTSSMLKL
ncbi:MAG: hypothetical protein KA716_20525 [Gloeotrichia echinulata DEX184]|nr:hypothetical protein [Gloeotrichia echinulata DEX184]